MSLPRWQWWFLCVGLAALPCFALQAMSAGVLRAGDGDSMDADTSKQRFVCLRRPHNTPYFSATASVSRLGGEHDEVWWEFRELYYKLPWSQNSDSLSRWLRRASNKIRLQPLLDFFEVPDDSIKANQRMLKAKDRFLF